MSALNWDDISNFMDELRSMARRLLAREAHGGAIQLTELVQTALRRQNPRAWAEGDFDAVTWESREQFFGRMHRAMRQALVEYARSRQSSRRIHPVNLDGLDLQDFKSLTSGNPELLEAALLALDELRQTEPRWVEAFEYWNYESLSKAEIGRLLGVSDKTVNDWLRRVQAQLRNHLKEHFED